MGSKMNETERKMIEKGLDQKRIGKIAKRWKKDGISK